MPQRRDTYTTPSGTDFTVYSYSTPTEIPGFNPYQLTLGRVKEIQHGPAMGRWMSVQWASPTYLFEALPEVPPLEVLPKGFEDIFGVRPVSEGDSHAFQRLTAQWENNLVTFVRSGPPADTEHPEAAEAEAIKYKLGPHAPYENIYGFQVRFPSSQVVNFQADYEAFTDFTGQVIVLYQNRLTNRSLPIPADLMHPLCPPVLLARASKVRKAVGGKPPRTRKVVDHSKD